MSPEGRLSPAEAAEVLRRSQPIAVERGSSPVPVAGIVGTDLGGTPTSALALPVEHPTLLLFLSADCGGCADLFAAAQPSADVFDHGAVRVVVVLRDEEDPGLRGLVGGSDHVVASTAWSAYRVQGAPFFSLVVPGLSTVATEGVAWGAAAVADHVSRALAGDLTVEVPRLEGA